MSYLPLSHIAGMAVDITMQLGRRRRSGHARSLALVLQGRWSTKRGFLCDLKKDSSTKEKATRG